MSALFCHQHVTKNQSIYQANGSGRDQYINYFGGGIMKDKVVHSEGVYGLGAIQKRHQHKRSFPSIDAKYAHYTGDGTGRDHYIICNEGGMTSQSNLLLNRSPNYLKSLRQYQAFQQPIKENDFLRRSMYTIPLKERKKQQSQYIFRTQNLLTQRLHTQTSTKDLSPKKKSQSIFNASKVSFKKLEQKSMPRIPNVNMRYLTE